MATYRITWFFEGFQEATGRGASCFYGWTESWYYTTAGNLDAALAFAGARGNNTWIDLRIRFLHSLYTITAIRAVDVGNVRRAKTVFKRIPGEAGNLTNLPIGNRLNAADPAQVTCALLVDFTRLPIGATDLAHHKRVLLRGLSAGAISGNVLSTSALYINPIIRFCNYLGRIESANLLAGARAAATRVPDYFLRYRDAGSAPYVPITALETAPANNKQIVLTAQLGAVTKGQQLRIAGTREPRGTTRVWTVLADAAGPPYSLGTARREVSGAWDGKGKASKVLYLYDAADQYNVVGMRVRHTGRPFVRTRGRRPTRE